MGKPKDKKKASIRTLDQAGVKEENVFKSHTGIAKEADRLNDAIENPKKELWEENKEEIIAMMPKSEVGGLEDLIASAEELICDPGLVYEGPVDDTHPLVIAEKTLQRFIDRLKVINENN